MKEFLKTNTVTYNLMSFTGFKSLLIFSLLLDGAKSYNELQEILENHPYLHETVSFDTLRIYLNSLREIGCKIVRKNDNGITRYAIDSHPFELKFDDKQIKSIIKIYKAISKSIDVSDLISLQQFFAKFSNYVTNEDLKIKLKNISPLNNINPKLIENLMMYAKNNTEITVYYNSKISGAKNITILVDKLHINNGKLYVSGMNSEYATYSSFLVSKIEKIVSVNLKNKTLQSPEIIVGYEYTKDENENFETLDCEKIIQEDRNKLIVEITSKNKFELTQRILFHSAKCKVLYPEDFQLHIISTLKKMKEEYIGKE